MNTNFFETTKPKFISIRENLFYIDGTKYSSLHVNIQDLLPVRKFFQNGKLACYAINSDTSSTGKNCSLCSDKFKCFMKVRIMMQVYKIYDELIPAALEVGKKEFQSLQIIINDITKEELCKKNIKLTFLNKKLVFTPEN